METKKKEKRTYDGYEGTSNGKKDFVGSILWVKDDMGRGKWRVVVHGVGREERIKLANSDGESQINIRT